MLWNLAFPPLLEAVPRNVQAMLCCDDTPRRRRATRLGCLSCIALPAWMGNDAREWYLHRVQARPVCCGPATTCLRKLFCGEVPIHSGRHCMRKMFGGTLRREDRFNRMCTMPARPL